MSLFSQLDQAITGAAQSVASDAANIVSTVTSGLQLQVQTNFLPSPFKVGGLSTSGTDSNGNAVQTASPGLLASLGVKYSVSLLDASGKTLFKYGDPPVFSPLEAGALGAATLGLAYLVFRGLRAVLSSR